MSQQLCRMSQIPKLLNRFANLLTSLKDFDYSLFKEFGKAGSDMGAIPVTYRIEDTAKGIDDEGNVTYYTINVTVTSSDPVRSKDKMYGKAYEK